MPTVPETNAARLTFYATHVPVWTANAAALGLDPAQVAALSALVGAARQATADAMAARNAARAATAAMNEAMRAMHADPGAGADIISAIRTHAQATGDEGVYTLAQIPAPAEPSPIGPPGRPTDFDVELVPANGALILKWKCPNPRGAEGTMYTVERQIGNGQVVRLDTVGTKSFTDAALPAGAVGTPGGVTYRVTAVRSTKRGEPGGITVNVGRHGVGWAPASAADAPRAAA